LFKSDGAITTYNWLALVTILSGIRRTGLLHLDVGQNKPLYGVPGGFDRQDSSDNVEIVALWFGTLKVAGNSAALGLGFGDRAH